jgi:hypothetical protein
MSLIRYCYCMLQGHAYIDITQSRRPYQYCLRCGKIKEPLAILKNRELHPCEDRHA